MGFGLPPLRRVAPLGAHRDERGGEEGVAVSVQERAERAFRRAEACLWATVVLLGNELAGQWWRWLT